MKPLQSFKTDFDFDLNNAIRTWHCFARNALLKFDNEHFVCTPVFALDAYFTCELSQKYDFRGLVVSIYICI